MKYRILLLRINVVYALYCLTYNICGKLSEKHSKIVTEIKALQDSE